MASWSWRGTKAREPLAAPPVRRPAVPPVPPGVVPQQARPAHAVPEVAALHSTSARPPLTGGGPAADPSPDAHLRRALALVELSRLVLDSD